MLGQYCSLGGAGGWLLCREIAAGRCDHAADRHVVIVPGLHLWHWPYASAPPLSHSHLRRRESMPPVCADVQVREYPCVQARAAAPHGTRAQHVAVVGMTRQHAGWERGQWLWDDLLLHIVHPRYALWLAVQECQNGSL